ncbi:MAG: hypothetical protein ACR2HR_16215 [Euzebya sp.]
MDPLKPRELIAAARVAEGMVYVAGLAGVVAGAQLFRRGDLPFAIVAWVLTFIAGAVLRLVAWIARGIAQIMERSERMEQDLLRLNRNSVAESDRDDQREDPYPRWGGWH